MQPLFIYGTLLDPDIFRKVTRTPLSRQDGVRATLKDHAAVYAYGELFPVLAPAPGASAQGLLLSRLGEAQWRALDAYEGREWSRGIVVVQTDAGPVPALAYVTQRYRPSREKFNLGGWQRRIKPRYLARLG